MKRDRFVTWVIIGLHIALIVVVALLITILSLYFLNIATTKWLLIDLVLGLAVSVYAWSQVIYKTKLFDYTFINVKDNWVVILGNKLKYDDIPPDENKRVKMFPRKSLREVGQGLRGKWPWEIPAASINLQSEILIGTKQDGKPLTCVTLDDIDLEIEYQVVLTPLVGFASNLFRKDEGAIKAYFKGIFEQRLLSEVRKVNESDIRDMAAFAEIFKGTLGGSETASKPEQQWGVFTGEPQLISIKRSARYQKAAEGRNIGSMMTDVVDTINEKFNGLPRPDPNLVLAAAATTVGNEISGILLIPGAGGTVEQLVRHAEIASKAGIKPVMKK